MSEQLPAKAANVFHTGGRKSVKIGEWRWVTTKPDDSGRSERLMCAYHLASNHVVFSENCVGGGIDDIEIRYRDLEKLTRIEIDWKAVIQKQIEEKQIELSAAVNAMIDMVRNAELLDESNQPQSMLPSTIRRDPVLMKKSLTRLKEKDYPIAKKGVERITQEIVALHQDMTLPMRAEAERMDKAIKTVDKRLFALEIYAGIGEKSKLIRRGKPADPETPISVRQMMRYMDEETLIDYDKGGMDFEQVEEFDEWISRPENIARIAPEPRCVVALQVRRHDKDYGVIDSLAKAFADYEKNKANKWTYLLIRNGEQIWRLICDIEFSPRLLPFKKEFVRPLESESRYNYKSGEYETELVTPDSLCYDEVLAKRLDQVYKYNRVMFLIQGLLDRSKVFSPHPKINLGDEAHVQKYFQAIFDEEMGLPSANPPVWEEYRDRLNATIKKGSLVWCGVGDEMIEFSNWRGEWKRPKYGHDAPRRPKICKVGKVSADRNFVTLTWEIGRRRKEWWDVDMNRPVPNKPGFYYQKKFEQEFEMRHGHQKVGMEQVFAVEAYKRGDYKTFLCDAYLKGEYLQWSPQLLGAESWLNKKKK